MGIIVIVIVSAMIFGVGCGVGAAYKTNTFIRDLRDKGYSKFSYSENEQFKSYLARIGIK